jgi:hypothetical protein
MTIYYVYAYLREDGTPYYIGKGKDKRAFKRHRKGKLPVPKDVSKIVFLQEELSEQDALTLEHLLIMQYGRIDLGTGILRNLTNGGEGSSGYIQSLETRQKIASAMRALPYKKRNVLPLETRQKIANTLKCKGIKPPCNKGRKQSQEHIAKRVASRKARKLEPSSNPL